MWFIFATLIVGLLLGSFLNVVIYRGPAMWGLVGDDRSARGTLIAPGSRCPHCGAAIRIRDLVPVASFVFLRGRCRACAARIPSRYPIVEILSAAACLSSLAVFGISIAALLASTFLLCLIALAAIDRETGYLPEALTLPTIAVGLAANAFAVFTSPLSAAVGAGVGYATFWVISFAYLKLRRREGLGLGDAALFSAIGAWSGWPALAPTAFLAALIGLAGAGLSAVRSSSRVKPDTEIKFGPPLAAAGAILFLLEEAASRGLVAIDLGTIGRLLIPAAP